MRPVHASVRICMLWIQAHDRRRIYCTRLAKARAISHVSFLSRALFLSSWAAPSTQCFRAAETAQGARSSPAPTFPVARYRPSGYHPPAPAKRSSWRHVRTMPVGACKSSPGSFELSKFGSRLFSGEGGGRTRVSHPVPAAFACDLLVCASSFRAQHVCCASDLLPSAQWRASQLS